MNLENSCIKRLIEVCAKLKLKVKSPFWIEDASAHIGIPSHKVTIHYRTFSERARSDVARQRWERLGWTLLTVTTVGIEKSTDDELVAHLASALKELKK